MGLGSLPKVEEANKVNWDFIRTLEGFENQLYVPCDHDGNVIGHSGATIGQGFDLGQQSSTSLARFNFGSDIEDMLLPYVGIQGQKAKNFLIAHPLKLLPNVVDQIQSKVNQVYYDDISAEYDRYSQTKFGSLPEACQTVFVSVCYQYGNVRDKCPKFFDLCTGGRWKDVVVELRNFGDSYEARRLKEADYLEGGLNT